MSRRSRPIAGSTLRGRSWRPGSSTSTRIRTWWSWRTRASPPEGPAGRHDGGRRRRRPVLRAVRSVGGPALVRDHQQRHRRRPGDRVRLVGPGELPRPAGRSRDSQRRRVRRQHGAPDRRDRLGGRAELARGDRCPGAAPGGGDGGRRARPLDRARLPAGLVRDHRRAGRARDGRRQVRRHLSHPCAVLAGRRLPRPVSGGARDRPPEWLRRARHAFLALVAGDLHGRRRPMLRLLETARDEGLDVTFDTYPYEWGGTRLMRLLPAGSRRTDRIASGSGFPTRRCEPGFGTTWRRVRRIGPTRSAAPLRTSA